MSETEDERGEQRRKYFRTMRKGVLQMAKRSAPRGTHVMMADAGALPKPSGLTATSGSATTADLAWNAVPGAATYKVYQDAVEIDEVSVLTTAVTGLTADTLYAFTVVAVPPATSSRLSSAASLTASVYTWADEYTLAIGANDQDGGETIATGANSATGNNISWNATGLNALVFASVAIGKGAGGVLIRSAKIQFTATATASGAMTTTLQCIAQDNTAVIGTTAFDLSGRPKTTASVAWAIPDWTSGDRTSAQLSAELSTIVQEVVSRSGWSSGNRIGFTGTRTAGSTTRQWAAFENATAQEAALIVTFQRLP